MDKILYARKKFLDEIIHSAVHKYLDCDYKNSSKDNIQAKFILLFEIISFNAIHCLHQDWRAAITPEKAPDGIALNYFVTVA